MKKAIVQAVVVSFCLVTFLPPTQAQPQPGVFLWSRSESDLGNYEKNWIGNDMAKVLDFPPRNDWTYLTGSSPGVGLDWWVHQWSNTGSRMVISLGMLPDNYNSNPINWTNRVNYLQQGANGAYDTYFQNVAAKLIANGYGNATIRLGWEFNGDWYVWSAQANPTNFKAFWKKIVLAMRSQGGNFKFNWCGTVGYCEDNFKSGTSESFDPSLAYPTDDGSVTYVDEIGVDIYDRTWAGGYPIYTTDSEATKTTKRNTAWTAMSSQGSYHLNWWAAFAASKGKPFTIPEWGLASIADDHGGDDNPIFIQNMYNFVNDASKNVSWHSYFNDSSDLDSTLYNDPTYPNAVEKFHDTFGPNRNEDFSDGVANEFTPSGGTWDIIADGTNVYRQSNNTVPNALSLIGNPSWNNYRISARAKVNSYGDVTYSGVGLMARYIDNNNYYNFKYYKATGRLEIARKVAGAVTVLAYKTYTFNTGTWYTLEFEVIGSVLKGYVNGVEQVSTTDTAIAAGRPALEAHRASVHFDDVTVTHVDLFENLEDNTANGWTPNGGTWAVITDGTNKVYQQSNNTLPSLWSNGGSALWNNYRIGAKIKAVSYGDPTFSSVGLQARYLDASNYYSVCYYNSGSILKISKIFNGTSSVLNSKPFTFSSGVYHTMEFEVVGSNLRMYVDGVLQLTAVDPDITSGKAGVTAHRANVYFDDITVNKK